jgi:NhaP-type Na+/H+ or K+/H+ antiporter
MLDCLRRSPRTDPISVLALLKQAGAPKPLEIQIAGESLFNALVR